MSEKRRKEGEERGRGKGEDVERIGENRRGIKDER